MRREHINLSPGLTPLAWLQSQGNAITGVGQWIDTGVQPYKLEVEIRMKEAEYGQQTGNLQLACGCWNANNNRYYVAQHGNPSQGNRDLYTSNKNNSIYKIADHNLNAYHTILYNDTNNKVWCDGVQKATISDITVQGLAFNVILFGGGTSTFSSGVSPSSWRICWTKFRDKVTNTYVRYYIPVLDANGVPALFDNVTQQLYYNQGTGQFTKIRQRKPMTSVVG